MERQTLSFTVKLETKHTVCHAEEAVGTPRVVSTLYVQRCALGERAPQGVYGSDRSRGRVTSAGSAARSACEAAALATADVAHAEPRDDGDMGRRSSSGSDRLRIAIVSPEVGSGAGVPHYWQALAAALSRRHEVHVFAAKSDPAALDGVRFHRIPTLRVGWFLTHATFYWAVRARFAFARLLRRRQFDVVLGIGALTPFADIATVHFVQARELDLQRRGAFPCERRPAALASLDYALYGRAMDWLGRRFYRHARQGIVAVSEAVKRDLVLFEGASPDSIVVVPNGVDVDQFHPANRERYRAETRRELGLSDTHVAVLFVGNSWGRKGLHTAIEAISGPGQADVRLVVVGDGVRDTFIDGLPAEVVERIIFVGTERVGIERFYAAADAFLLPTLYEPFGLVILEALASGLPAIVSAAAGASEWLDDGVHAVLLRDPSDGAEARAALRSVVTKPEFAAKLAANGRCKALQLQWSTVATGLIAAAPVRLRSRAHSDET